MITSSAQNNTACEVCGALPANAYHAEPRSGVAYRGARYSRGRTNRVRLDANYLALEGYRARLVAAGIADWAGKLACAVCAAQWRKALNPQ